ncbi:hypothetical protein FOXG_22659 [Fusarium oxysporum f. sp. lycopersici 4287]|uniref:Uncharacterized protein n=1 Tax=Fusarium oxysporum f. sp. lycopersici (strain 4287 / CBS 123668 / FGSC 9935 / NRRL 34936) TaxID=426428 RepID=A0A0J9VWP3_FUSO4|nr:hypothetical protein FOXG_21049 [Fusarium oxysporum f. sp. lycopersici 4287]XP_018253444.1 hypothetical protein FOXG_21308 [Fusarium oxysporum f. sp. lycopersici 4287]XP_018257908.1 hypothetical protein FOXG_22659 [Fusarium oxysporum f. sp. lycopersici 4287]KNB14113.1 hypothetical protein FOXG_21049 [Fusarium oxysporum f. sp. lycopersici 4287]KNB15399.1 hypothetical protein FOXG_21308 [Fusarium oxysporum f. sp. lycopersici 4287]KNB19863.1 hypothetical protein FOXG_22659 [Fusarium oxysporum 
MSFQVRFVADILFATILWAFLFLVSSIIEFDDRTMQSTSCNSPQKEQFPRLRILHMVIKCLDGKKTLLAALTHIWSIGPGFRKVMLPA